MEQYVAELDGEAKHVAADSLQEVTEEEARRFATISKLAQAGSVERAKRVLMNEKKHCRTDRVATALFALAAVAAPADEATAAAAACAAVLARKQKPVKVTQRLAARAVGELRGAASPGPSGWRSTHIALLSRTIEGRDVVAAILHLMLAGELAGGAAELWNAEILEPVDRGPAP